MRLSCIILSIANVVSVAADWKTCKAADLSYNTAVSAAAAACLADATECPPALQEAVDTCYAECGGLDEAGAEWDEGVGLVIKKEVEQCSCSGASKVIIATCSDA